MAAMLARAVLASMPSSRRSRGCLCHPSWHRQASSLTRDAHADGLSVSLQADRPPRSGAIAGGPMRLTYDATSDVAYLSLRPLAQRKSVGPRLLLETDRAFVQPR